MSTTAKPARGRAENCAARITRTGAAASCYCFLTGRHPGKHKCTCGREWVTALRSPRWSYWIERRSGIDVVVGRGWCRPANPVESWALRKLGRVKRAALRGGGRGR